MSDVRLLPGECLLWSGLPGQGLILRPIDAFLIPFSLLLGGFALFWNGEVWVTGAPWEMRLFGLPFLAAGFYVTVGRFLHDMWLRSRIRYGVTDRRVLIVRGGSTRSLDLGNLPLLDMDERGDGTGTIRFGESASPFGHNGVGSWSPALDSTPQFLRIENVRRVYELIVLS